MSKKTRLPSVKALLNPIDDNGNQLHPKPQNDGQLRGPFSSDNKRPSDSLHSQEVNRFREHEHNGTGASSSSQGRHFESLPADMRSKQPRLSMGQRLPSVNELLKSTQREHTVSASKGSASIHDRGTPVNEYGNSSIDNPSKPKHPCEQCGRLFSRKSDALKHIRVVHERVKDFACCVCGRKFARKDYCTVCAYHLYTT